MSQGGPEELVLFFAFSGLDGACHCMSLAIAEWIGHESVESDVTGFGEGLEFERVRRIFRTI